MLAACVAIAFGAHAEESAAQFENSVVPGYPSVVGEYLQIPGADAPGTPSAFNTASFLRLRTAADGETPKPVNVAIVAMPGFASTPNHWLYLGAQLVHKASERQCAEEGEKPAACRLEIWIVQRRGANLAETAGGRDARAKRDPTLAIDYYFGRSVLQSDPNRPGLWPLAAPHTLVGKFESKWRALTQRDLKFMAEWSFEVYAGDVDRMIALIRERSGARNIFLAGHSQGGGFVANYAGRLQPDGRRGYEKLSGLIFLDGGPSAGTNDVPTPTDLQQYFERVSKLRSGEANVYSDGSGALGDLAGPEAAAAAVVTNAHYALVDPNAVSIFGPRGIRATAASPAGDDFLANVKLTYLARAGMSFDVDPLPGLSMQVPILARLGEGLGRLDFTPIPGSEKKCDNKKPVPPCIPTAEQLDPKKVYGWIEGGGGGGVNTKVGKARLWLGSQGYAPSRSNIRPARYTFPSGARRIDASNMVATNWYPSERYDSDMQFWGRFKKAKVNEQGTHIDIDKSEIKNIAVYVARQSAAESLSNPFPLVTDFTEINKTGTHQTGPAAGISSFDSKINVRHYFHTDFVSADDSLAGKVTPGEPGASAVANTLVEWLLTRARGKSDLPLPTRLGVYETY